MLIVTGTLLVLGTWLVVAVGLVLIGLPLSSLTHRGALGTGDLRRGVWWGLLVVAVGSYMINLAVPLASAATAVVLVLMVVLGAVSSALMISRRSWDRRVRIDRLAGVIAAGACVPIAYLAVAALGPVTNYDSGLYHLGAVRYAADYATVPGLANLYFPFGYANAEFPLAGLLQNGPWGIEGYRLLNGFVISLVLVDLMLRAMTKRRAGFFVLLAGVGALLVPMVALSDYWVTSPSQDSAVFAVTVAAVAMLAEAVATSRRWEEEAAAALAVGLLLVLLRPTMIAFTACLVLIAVVLRTRRGRQGSPAWGWAAALVLVASGLAVVAAVLRDYVLSGWLQYPLSVFHFDVPWLAPDPVYERTATLGFHRDPTDLWAAADGWTWVLPWFRRLPEQWESYLVAGLLVVLAVAGVLVWRSTGRARWRALAVCMAPSAVMTVVWWTSTPPSFRFAWGPVLTLLTIPIGWLCWRLSTTSARASRGWTWALAAGVLVPVVAVTLYSAAARFSWASVTQQREWRLGISVPYAVSAVTDPAFSSVPIADDLVVRVPSVGEQCWIVYPLCTPRPDLGVRLRDGTLSGGFERTAQAGL